MPNAADWTQKEDGRKAPLFSTYVLRTGGGEKSQNLLHRYTYSSFDLLKVRVTLFQGFSPRGMHVRSLDTEMFVTALGFPTSIAAETRTYLSRLPPRLPLAITALFSPLACHPYIFPLWKGETPSTYSPFSLSSP